MLKQELLKSLLHYNRKTGVFTWKVATSGHRKGAVAGCKATTQGYRKIGIDGKRYLSHRLAWFYVHGVWPVNQIDHRDGVKDNNAINNLRDVTLQVNKQNLVRAHKNNKTGFLGVTINKSGKYKALIGINGKNLNLGIFDTPEEAHEHYLTAKRIHHKGCTI